MAQVTITQLPVASALTGTEPVPVVQNGVTVQTTTGAIAGAGALNYPFLTANSTAGLTQARYLTTNSGLSLTDGGAGSTMQINLIGAAQSLNSSGNGIQVKTSGTTLTAVSLAVTTGLTVTNADGTAGNPTIGLGTALTSINTLGSSAAQGLVTVSGSAFGQTAIAGTTNQINVANGNAQGGQPTVSIANNPVLPGNAFVQVPSGTTSQRGTPQYGALRYNSDVQSLETYTQATGWGSIVSGSGVSTFSAGSTGFSPNTATTGAVVLTGVLNPASGGTGINNGTNVITVGGNITHSGAYNQTFIATGNTSVTLPTNGVLSTVSNVETLSNKTISGLSNTLTNIGNSSLTNSTITINGNAISLGGSATVTASTTSTLTIGTGLTGTSFNGSAPVTIAIDSTVATLSGAQTLTNKTISGASNTLSNIANASLSNSSVTFNGSTVALGGSATITANTNNALTIGTGLTGTSFNGGSAVTIGIDSSVATLTGVQTLTNKTINGSNNTLTNIGNSSLTNNSITLGTTTIALGATSLTPAGLTSVTVTQDPVSALQLATKQYVDAAASNVNYHAACNYATTADLGTVTYNNGTSGVGATITKTSPFATLAIDGANPSVGQRILVKNETSGQYNGIYTVTSVGSGAAGWVLTRATDYDQTGTGANEIAPGDTTFIISGSTNAGTQWVQTTDLPITIGTTPIAFAQIGGPGSYTAGTGLTLSGTQFSITNTAVTPGSYTNANITINAQGQITTASNGAPGGVTTFQTSLSGLTPSTATTGAVTLAGTLGISSGGTGQTTASSAFNALSPITSTGDLIIGTGTNSASRLGIGTNGYVLTSNGTTATWSAIPTTGVTSFSAGTTGLTPSTGTTGAVTLAGTLNVANGGTGATTLTGLAYGNGTSAFTAATAAQVVSTIGTTAVTNATNATNVALSSGAGATNYIPFASTATGNQALTTNASFTYNYTNNALTAGINGGTF